MNRQTTRVELTDDVAFEKEPLNTVLVVGRDVNEKREQTAFVLGLTIDGSHYETTAMFFIRRSPETVRELGDYLRRETRKTSLVIYDSKIVIEMYL